MDAASPLLAAAGVFGLFSAAAALIVQLFRESGRLRKERDGEIKELKADVRELKQDNKELKAENYACRLQVNSLVGVLREEGIAIPDWLLRDH